MIKHNCNKYTLLSNSDIIISTETNDFYFHIPTLKELYTSKYDPNFFLGFMTLPIEEFGKKMNMEIADRVGYIKDILSFEHKDDYMESLLYFLRICTKNALGNVDEWLVMNEKILTDQVLNAFICCFQLAMGSISLSEFNTNFTDLSVKKTEEELAWEKRKKLLESKISRTKAKAQQGSNDIENILLVISVEFNMSLEDLMNKNFYTIYALYAAAIKVDAHRVSLIALGNGLSKQKYKHWINIK